MYTLTLTSDIFRVADSALIPATASNIDYQQYLAWVALGNTPGPYVPPPAVSEIELGAATIVFKTAATEAFRINGSQQVSGLKVTELNSGPLAGFRNRIINGGMDVWQRGTSVTPPLSSTTAYVSDRWVSYQTGVAVAIARSPGGTKAKYSAAWVGVAGNTEVTMIQYIESVNTHTMQNGDITASCEIYSSVAKTFTIYLDAPDSIDLFTAFSGGNSAAVAHPGTGWHTVPLSVTWASPGVSATRGLRVRITVNNCTTGFFRIACVQLEQGTVATPFEFRPYSVELALCQRYYQRIDQDMGWYVGAGGGTLKTPIMHPEMRVTPSWSTVTAGTLVGATAASLVSTSPHSAAMSLVSTAGAGTSTITGRVWESVGAEL